MHIHLPRLTDYLTIILAVLLPAATLQAGITQGSKNIGAVWFVGDSITQSNADGDPSGSPRKSLYDLLAANGYIFTYTGSSTASTDGLTGVNYTSHSGYSASMISTNGTDLGSRVDMTATLDGSFGTSGVSNQWGTGLLRTVKPNVVLIMLGTNDVHQLANVAGRTIDDIASDLQDYVNKIHTLPGADSPTVFITTIPPNRRSDYGRSQPVDVAAFNALVPQVVTNLRNAGKDVHLVDCFTPLDAAYATAMNSDNLHPNATGNGIIARRWYSAIANVVSGSDINLTGSNVSAETDNTAAAGMATAATYTSQILTNDLINSGQATLASATMDKTPSTAVNPGTPALNDGLGHPSSGSGTGAYLPLTFGSHGKLPFTYTATLNTATHTQGYEITKISSFAGWNQNGSKLANQKYELQVSYLGDAGFVSLGTFTYAPFDNSNTTEAAATMVELTDTSGIIATNVDAVRFIIMDHGFNNGLASVDGSVFHEFDVIGSPAISASAANRYWKNTASATWTTANAWASTSGGSDNNTWNSAAPDNAFFNVAGSIIGSTATVGTITANQTIGVTAGGTLTIGGAISVASGKILQFNSQVLSGSGGITKTGGGLLAISSTGNSLSGTATVSAGSLQLGGNENFGFSGYTIDASSTIILISPDIISDTANVDIASTGILSMRANEAINGLTGSGTVENSNSLNGTYTLTVGAGDATSSFGGVIRDGNVAGTRTGRLALTKTGAGVLSLSGINTFTGPTHVQQGTLRLEPGSLLPANLKIYPLGDSITYGANSGYRYPLYTLLNPVAPGFQFVGDSNISAGSLPSTPIDQRYHAGHSSYSVGDINNNLDGLDTATWDLFGGADRNPNGGYWFTGGNGTGRAALFPDTILLLCGANDINRVGMAGAQGRVESLLTKIATLRPDARVFLAKITPYVGREADVTAYNTILTNVASNFQAAGKKVTLVDLFTGFNTAWLTDGVHPNATGYTWMANKWYEALVATYAAEAPSQALAASTTITVDAGATLEGPGQLAGTLTVRGTVAPGIGIGTIAAGNTTITGTYECQLDGISSDQLTITGNLDLNGATIHLSELVPATASSYLIATYSGTLLPITSPPILTGLTGYRLDTSVAGQIKLSIITGFEAWALTTGNAPNGEPNDDSDKDGVANAIEYVLGGDKDTNDLGKLPAIQKEGANIKFSFVRDHASIGPDAVIAIEVGTTLSAWPLVYPVPDGPSANNPGVTVIDNLDGTDTVTLTLPMSPDTVRFARLRVTIAPLAP